MDLPYDLPKTGDFHVNFRLFKPNHSIPVGSVPVVLQVHGGHTHHGDTPRAKEQNGERVGWIFGGRLNGDGRNFLWMKWVDFWVG